MHVTLQSDSMKGKTSWKIHSRGKDSIQTHDNKVLNRLRWFTIGTSDGEPVDTIMDLYIPKKTGHGLTN
jgi:hypothetical protein